jgi:hypothetical protein
MMGCGTADATFSPLDVAVVGNATRRMMTAGHRNFVCVSNVHSRTSRDLLTAIVTNSPPEKRSPGDVPGLYSTSMITTLATLAIVYNAALSARTVTI